MNGLMIGRLANRLGLRVLDVDNGRMHDYSWKEIRELLEDGSSNTIWNIEIRNDKIKCTKGKVEDYGTVGEDEKFVTIDGGELGVALVNDNLIRMISQYGNAIEVKAQYISIDSVTEILRGVMLGYREEVNKAVDNEAYEYKLLDNGTYSIVGINEAYREHINGEVHIPVEYKGIRVSSIGRTAFKEAWQGIEKLVVGSNIDEIGDRAFRWLKELKEIDLGQSRITQIKKRTFEGCTKLEKITLGDEVEAIGNMAFQKCRSLGEIKLGNNVKIIGDSAFDGCRSINIKAGESVRIIEINAFNNVGEVTTTHGSIVESYCIAEGVKTNTVKSDDIKIRRRDVIGVDMGKLMVGASHRGIPADIEANEYREVGSIRGLTRGIRVERVVDIGEEIKKDTESAFRVLYKFIKDNKMFKEVEGKELTALRKMGKMFDEVYILRRDKCERMGIVTGYFEDTQDYINVVVAYVGTSVIYIARNTVQAKIGSHGISNILVPNVARMLQIGDIVGSTICVVGGKRVEGREAEKIHKAINEECIEIMQPREEGGVQCSYTYYVEIAGDRVYVAHFRFSYNQIIDIIDREQMYRMIGCEE